MKSPRDAGGVSFTSLEILFRLLNNHSSYVQIVFPNKKCITKTIFCSNLREPA